MEHLPEIFKIKSDFYIKKKVPGFVHVRRKLNDELSPKIYMKYGFMKKSDQSIEVVHCENAPIKDYPTSHYIKLYEEAHIEVIDDYWLIALVSTFLKSTYFKTLKMLLFQDS